MRKIYYPFLLLIALLFQSVDLLATTFSAGDWNANYNFCGGYTEINVLYYDKSGQNDWMDWANIYYKNSAGNRVHIFSWATGTMSGASGTDETDGDDFSFRFENGSVMNWNWYYVGGNEDLVAMSIKWYNPPADLYGTSMEISIDGHWHGGGGDDDAAIDNWKNNVTVTKVDAPTNLSATTDTHCDKVRLTWTNPSIVCGSSWRVEVYRNNTYLGNAGTNGSFDDYSAVKGVTYDYKLQTVFTPNAYTTNKSDFTTNIQGRRKGPYVAPTAFITSTDRCDGKVKLEWQWNGMNPEGFGFYRSTNAAFTGAVFSRLNIAGDKRAYEDTVPQKNVTYYYRMVSINNCNDRSVYSSVSSGFAPDVPAAPTNVTAVADNVLNRIVITWQDNSGNETGFIVRRTLFGGGGVSTFNVAANATQYIDNTIINCQTYSYEVLAKNHCAPEGLSNDISVNAKLVPDLSNTFANGGLKVSKGYYPNLVKLTWANVNQNQLNTFKLYRRIVGDAASPTLVATLNSGSALYNDYTADAGVMYEYFIEAEGVCENSTLVSNRISDVGFRSPTGIINGHVSYKGGIAVEGVKVIVSRTSGASGNALYFDGTNKVSTLHTSKLTPSNALTLSAWIAPKALAGDMTFISKSNGGNGYGLDYAASGNKVRFWIYDGGGLKAAEMSAALLVNNYTNLTGVFDGSNVKLYVNGELKSTVPAGASILSSTADLFLGAYNGTSNYYHGNMDEVQVWNKAKTAAEIALDYSRILNGNESGLIAYWRMDEGVGSYIFDASNAINIYNEHHGSISGASWTTEIPTSTQLGLMGITNASGDYTINNVRYNGAGETFTLTPFFQTHTFEPSTKVLYIGDGSNVQNNQDFTDNSSFKVTGTVKFKGTSCFSKDVQLKIDGNLVIKDGVPVQTAADGTFEIEVPIGKHKVSVEKTGHVFEAGVFPANGTYDFQAPVSGIEFIDSTLITVVGRVVGGLREGNKAPGMGRSINNIGKASITFTAQQNGGCTYQAFTTNDVTGEYMVKLPPLKYIVSELKIPSNLAIDFGTLDLIDLTPTMEYQKVVDTIFIAGTKLVKQIDSARFHLRKDYIYRVAPEMTVMNDKNTAAFTGDKESMYIDKVTGDTTVIDLAGDPFGYPVFTTEKIYQARISVFERYINKDNGANKEDKVPVSDGKITINNNIGDGNPVVIELTKGDTLYTFEAGQPNVLADNTTPQYSYTKTFQILAEVGPYGIPWEPRTDGDRLFRAYVFGGKSKGNAFATQGPQVVDKILRDPPGTNSYATIQEGTSSTTFSSWEVNTSAGLTFEKNVLIGTKFTLGLGLQTPTEIKNNLSFGTTIESSVTPSGEYKETVTFTENFQTSSSPSDVGAPADLFIGKSQNILFGATDNLYLLPNSMCGLPGIECTGISHNGFQIGKRTGIFVIPGGPETMFIYDQDHIENYLIPDLKRLRNNLFVAQPAKYVSKIAGSNANFGTNNDDKAWGSQATSNDPAITTEPADYDGPSYKFIATSGNNGNIDSVRYYNQQIRLWQEALAKNEKEKLEAVLEKNISFNAGPQYTFTQTTETEETSITTWEVGLTEDIKLVLGATVGGTGFETENHLNFSVKGGESKGSTTVETMTYSYLLEDENKGDYFSVDIKKSTSGNGPVFKTVAGKSSCPFEDVIKTKYYQPGAELSAATMQREIPTLEVRPNKLINVPADQVAVFNLSLGNESASDDDMTYTLKVLENTNPNGAVIEVDGESPNRAFDVLAGTSINKQLTIKKGPVENIYNDIKIVFQSPCDNIADTVTVSVHFLPSCSPVSFIQPEDKWVVNNSFNDTLPVVIGGYNINYESLQKLQFQYKPSSSSQWINLQNFLKDTTGIPNSKPIPTNDFYTTYPWELSQLPDGDYDIRAVSNCTLADVFSETFSGHIDRVNPHPFGNPQPADGILSPNDEIEIQFNEVIDAGKLTRDNFDVRGVLNGTSLRHGASVYFDGDANHYVEIPDGISLVKSSLTLEFWAKRQGTGKEILLSQGKTEQEALYISFDDANKLTFGIAGNVVTGNTSVTDNEWHHYACTYDANTLDVQLYIDGASDKTINNLEAIYQATGIIIIGKSSFNPASPFKGNVHEVRVWNKARTQAELVAAMNKLLSGREVSLVGNWKLDEAFGLQAKDGARSRHSLVKAQWAVEPSGRSISLENANDYLEISAGELAFTKEMDFTIEFWFKGRNGSNICLFSNGKGDGTDSNPESWSVTTDASGKIKVNNNGRVFNATNTNFFDNNWHHFALVVRRLGNTMTFIDGNLHNTTTSGEWNSFGGAKIWMGARGWYSGVIKNFDLPFDGKVDEVRIWSSARIQDQIQRDMNSRLSGDEFGLKAYYPFESYQENMGVMILSETLEDQSSENNNAVLNGATYSTETPTIKLSRPVQKVNFSYSVNQDKIIITPTDPAYLIENCILDVTVRDVRDLSNNKMQSPATWSAYIDKNQVVWEDLEKKFEKELGADLTFKANIINNGGNQYEFTIGNLPAWLTAEPASGQIGPKSFKEITFKVDPNLIIGNYSQNIYLSTSFGFDEVLLLNLNVFKNPPADWVVNPDNYQYSMNIVGQVSIGGIISTDKNDRIAAFVNGECRGVASLEYVSAYDMYEAFLSIFSNVLSGEEVTFKIWNASEGKIQSKVTPDFDFVANTSHGIPSAPVIFNAADYIVQDIPVSKGWRWISFNLQAPELENMNYVMKDVNAANGDIIKGIKLFDQYGTQSGWIGSITSFGGIRNEEMYKVRFSATDTIIIEGSRPDPSTKPISLSKGWNWIGFISQKNIPLNEALSNLNAASGDIIKSQFRFAVYDVNNGWVGNLTALKPGEGYMYKSDKATTFVYPKPAISNTKNEASEEDNLIWEVKSEEYKDNMSLVAIVQSPAALTEEDILGAFVNGVCRGTARPVFNPLTNEYNYFLTIYSNEENENIEFKWMEKGAAAYKVKETLPYASNSISGSLSKPVVLTLAEAEENSAYIYPNPVNEQATIKILLKENSQLKVEIVDMFGKLIGTVVNQYKEAGQYEYVWNTSSLSPGVYFVKVHSNSEVENHKIIKQ